MRPIILTFTILLMPHLASGGQTIHTLESGPERLVMKIVTEVNAPDDLKPITILIGIPADRFPLLSVSGGPQINHAFPEEGPHFTTEWIGKQILNGLNTASLQISPRAGPGRFFQEQTLTILFQPQLLNQAGPTSQQQRLLSVRVQNWETAQHWLQPVKKRLYKQTLFPAGQWLSFTVSDDGMARLPATTIHSTLGTGANIEPRSLRLYTGSNLGRDRTYTLTQRITSDWTIPENMVEVAMEITGADDGNLDDGDELRFWARGSSGFDQNNGKITWHQNLYFTENTYWLLVPEDSSVRGQRISEAPVVSTGALSLDYGLSYLHYERDLVNPYQSGLGWGHSPLIMGGTFSQPVEFVHPVPSVQVTGKVSFLGGEIVSTRYGNTQHSVTLQTGGISLTNFTWLNLGQKTGNFTFSGSDAQDGTQTFDVTNTSFNPNSRPYFDYLTLFYGRRLTTDYGPFDFYAPLTGNDITFSIVGSDVQVWEITNHSHPRKIPVETSAGQSLFTTSLPEDTLAHFALFDPTLISEVTNITYVGTKDFNQIRNNAAGVEHMVIGPREFEAAVQPLINHRGSSRFISLESIYDEFSGGNKDPVAIRHFIQWTQEQWPDPKPYCAFLLGDGDYDYRNITGLSTTKVPTIEVGILNSHATDDRLAAYNGIIPEIALGRFPAQNVDEVTDFVAKIIAFETQPIPGTWKQRVTLVADDPARPERELHEISTGKSHTFNSDRLAKIIPDFIELNKLYMVDFPEVSDGSIFGVIKPEATAALFQLVLEGTSIINFIGHGNSKQWAQEKLLIINDERNDAMALKTEMKLPIWIAGTCNWGQFDQLGDDSFAEVLIRIPMDGASAIISTTRGITVSSNIFYLERIFSTIFPDNKLTTATLGTVLQSVKSGGTSGELLHLFGDPGMPIPIPAKQVLDAKITPDTLQTLAVGTLTGTNPFNTSGEGFLTLQDGSHTVTREYNYISTTQEITYEESGPVLFRGRFSFEGNHFSTEFRIPKDITYSPNPSRARFLLSAADGDEAIGGIGGIVLTLGTPSTDTQGPIITFETEDRRTLRSGDHLGQDEKLVIRISDPLGINIAGEKGHEILLADLTAGETTADLTNGFLYDLNSITTGTLPYTIPPGIKEISLRIRAWDNANNLSEQEISLSILKSEKLTLLHVLNYPNPFSTSTQFTFEITAPAEVSVDIYTLEGRRIKSLPYTPFSIGFHSLDWDGRDEYGGLLANGVYLYRMKAKDGNKTTSIIGRLAKFR